MNNKAVGLVVALTLTWQNSSAVLEGTAIERLTGGTWKLIVEVGPKVEMYVDDEASEGCYRVRAFNAAGFSQYSNTACYLKAPVNLTVK